MRWQEPVRWIEKEVLFKFILFALNFFCPKSHYNSNNATRLQTVSVLSGKGYRCKLSFCSNSCLLFMEGHIQVNWVPSQLQFIHPLYDTIHRWFGNSLSKCPLFKLQPPGSLRKSQDPPSLDFHTLSRCFQFHPLVSYEIPNITFKFR